MNITPSFFLYNIKNGIVIYEKSTSNAITALFHWDNKIY